jgi:gliding motility-associated-like protein
VYTVRGTSANGCVSTDSIEVRVNKGDANNGYPVPSAFTPNGDGLNDCFGVRNWGNVSNFQLEVFDRAGFRVFRSQDPSKCWDGTFAGETRPGAAYVFQVSANTICGRVYRKGTVVLIR